VGREEDADTTEKEVFDKCLAVVEGECGLVVADFGARNIERLVSFAEVAKRTGRRLLVTAKDAYMLHALGCCDGKCTMDEGDVGVYGELKNRSRDKWETEIVVGRWGDSYVFPESIRKSPGDFILSFSFFDLKHLLDIKPIGGLYIYSSSEAHSEEQEFDFVRLGEWLKFFNLNPRGFRLEGDPPKPVFEKGFHASGHLSQKDLINLLADVDPDRIIPIHTQHPEWFNAKFPKTVTISPNGKVNQ
jgi:ribonuclease J